MLKTVLVNFRPVFLGSSDGQEWLWENQYAVDNFRKLYRKRHEKIRRNK